MKQIEKNNGNRNWRNIYLLGAVSFFNDFASEMIYPLIPVFINSVLGLGAAFIGIIEGIAETTNSLIKLFSGYFSDKFNKRKAFVIAGYTISNLLRPLIGIVSSWGGLLFLRFSDRVGKGIRTAPRDALIGDCAPAQRRGFAFGFHRSMDHLGAVVGSLVASLILYVFLLDIRKVFLLSIIPGIIAILIIIFGVKEVTRKINGQKKSLGTNAIKGGNSDTKKDGKIVKKSILNFREFKTLGGRFSYFLSILVIFALGNSTDAFLLLRASDLGIKTAAIPLLWAVHHISKAIFSTLGGHISDKLGRKTMIICGWVVYFLTYFGFAFANVPYMIWVLFVFYGLFFGFTEGVEKAFVCDMVPKDNLGTAYGFYNLAIGLSALPASLIFGFVWKVFSFKAAFIMGACIAAVALIMLLFLKTGNFERKSYEIPESKF
ncbi:MAG: MFS transporter [Actinobacteria bacterium]|nr:MFS transporter [Actinomycetota bacterium]